MNKCFLALLLMVGISSQAAELESTAASAPPAEIGVIAPATSEAATAPAAVVSTKDLKETEIPVHLEPTKKAAGAEGPLLKIIMSIGIVGVLGCAAFFLIRKYKFHNPRTQATQIKVLTQHFLGPKKSLAIVRVAGESILIGITDQNISMLKSLSLLDEDIPEEAPKEFHSIFAKRTAPVQFSDENESKDEFSISGIKDIVSGKLKNMRSLE